jgi:hypothetical protein
MSGQNDAGNNFWNASAKTDRTEEAVPTANGSFQSSMQRLQIKNPFFPGLFASSGRNPVQLYILHFPQWLEGVGRLELGKNWEMTIRRVSYFLSPKKCGSRQVMVIRVYSAFRRCDASARLPYLPY